MVFFLSPLSGLYQKVIYSFVPAEVVVGYGTHEIFEELFPGEFLAKLSALRVFFDVFFLVCFGRGKGADQ